MKNKAIFGVFWVFIFIFMVFSGCGEISKTADQEIPNKSVDTDVEIQEDEGEPEDEEDDKPFVFEHSLPDGYRYYFVTVHFTNEESLNFKTYKLKDFPEINCVNINNQNEGTMRLAQAQYEAEKTGDWSGLEDRIKSGMLMDLDKYIRMVDLIVLENGNINLVRAVNRLLLRNDISLVNWPYWARPDFIPNNGYFRDLGLNVETEKQIKKDYFYTFNNEFDQFTGSFETVHIDYFFGAYNGYYVIGMEQPMHVITNITVGGFRGSFPNFTAIYVWKYDESNGTGRFYDLTDAYYNLGFLTHGDTVKMNELHRNGVTRQSR